MTGYLTVTRAALAAPKCTALSAAINASTIPSVASRCTSNKDIDASRTRWATLRSRANAADNEKACRAYTALFYESVTLRQVAARRVDGERNLVVLDSETNAFNDLLATNCSSGASPLSGNGNLRGARNPLRSQDHSEGIPDLCSVTASILGPARRGHPDADHSLLPVPFEGG
jgi:hypothetical protein